MSDDIASVWYIAYREVATLCGIRFIKKTIFHIPAHLLTADALPPCIHKG